MAAAGMKKLAALSTFASLNVYAIAEEEAPQKPLKPTQLPIYNVPSLHSKYIEEQPGRLQTGIASVRTTACHYVGWCKGVYVWMKNGIMDTVQFGKDAYVYLKNPPQDFFPKIGVITASGLVGLISAKKGSKFKKIAYPLGLTALGASVCYPAQAIVITKVTGKKAYATSQQIYEVLGSLWTQNYTQQGTKLKEVKLRGDVKLDAPATVTVTESRVSTLSAEVVGKLAPSSAGAVTATQFKADPKLMDHGQSNPEDVDMYSTRS
ncbi:MICOS complex subunit MIC27 isoform X1 [Trichosurus vulpecula]|uniref:MICOS complex subunit MIC27 isoform X1 n=1 Tax=Trichosurus vulpecula TaxID=9337 RepID=UPI00186AF59F|nr:MICOS complex subunit MIC27 isoform X1 [Trichosurus vulpecula]